MVVDDILASHMLYVPETHKREEASAEIARRGSEHFRLTTSEQ